MMMMMMMVGDHHKPFSGRMFEGMMDVGLGMIATSETETSSTGRKITKGGGLLPKKAIISWEKLPFFRLWEVHQVCCFDKFTYPPWNSQPKPLKIGGWKRMHFLSGFGLSGAFAESFREHIYCILLLSDSICANRLKLLNWRIQAASYLPFRT